ncbi:hypothetical protein Fbal_3640 [Ferrimonas balearica DSM 9799]|uniref:Uncharacterized protein n=1 Tax=Ferrimonas balearica (strain DSM 9799 / CCM 4581 / KCTC 23876 / PAT) TaxID=550540 RepID=E1SPL9_FERBD|nr:hypothetical protein Fbal_3640 [Ferrimonas balearica DSM 9799]
MVNYISKSRRKPNIKPDSGSLAIFLTIILISPLVMFFIPVPGYIILSENQIHTKIICIAVYIAFGFGESVYYLSSWNREEIIYFVYSYGKRRTAIKFAITFFSQGLIYHFIVLSPFFVDSSIEMNPVYISLAYLGLLVILLINLNLKIRGFNISFKIDYLSIKLLLIGLSSDMIPSAVALVTASIIYLWIKSAIPINEMYAFYALFISIVNLLLVISIIRKMKSNLNAHRHFINVTNPFLFKKIMLCHKVLSFSLFSIFILVIQII